MLVELCFNERNLFLFRLSSSSLLESLASTTRPDFKDSSGDLVEEPLSMDAPEGLVGLLGTAVSSRYQYQSESSSPLLISHQITCYEEGSTWI